MGWTDPIKKRCQKCGAEFTTLTAVTKYCVNCREREEHGKYVLAAPKESLSMAMIRRRRVKAEGGWRGQPRAGGYSAQKKNMRLYDEN